MINMCLYYYKYNKYMFIGIDSRAHDRIGKKGHGGSGGRAIRFPQFLEDQPFFNYIKKTIF